MQFSPELLTLYPAWKKRDPDLDSLRSAIETLRGHIAELEYWFSHARDARIASLQAEIDALQAALVPVARGGKPTTTDHATDRANGIEPRIEPRIEPINSPARRTKLALCPVCGRMVSQFTWKRHTTAPGSSERCAGASDPMPAALPDPDDDPKSTRG